MRGLYTLAYKSERIGTLYKHSIDRIREIIPTKKVGII